MSTISNFNAAVTLIACHENVAVIDNVRTGIDKKTGCAQEVQLPAGTVESIE